MVTDERREKRAYRNAKKLDDLHNANRDQFVIAALQTPEGRDYFYWLLELCHVGHQPYNGNALDTAFRCGELNVGQQVQAHLLANSPSSFLKMLTEKEEERKAHDRLNGNGQPELFDPDGDGDADRPDA